MTITMTLVGAGLGVLIDRARNRSELRVVLRQPVERRAFRLAPLVGRGQGGVALAMHF
jgi:hypothetical protein